MSAHYPTAVWDGSSVTRTAALTGEPILAVYAAPDAEDYSQIVAEVRALETALVTGPLGLFGATPVTQPTSANEAAIGALTTQTLTAATGSASTTIADVTATPTQTLINNNFKSVATEINHIGADLATVKTLVNQLRADLVSLGAIKGS